MLTRLHVENYRSFVDLTLELGPKNLLMGLNGTGKSSLFDVLWGVRELVVEGEKCEELFPLTTLPRWLRGSKPGRFQQKIELELEGPEGAVRYTLLIEQDEVQARSRVLSECLYLEDRLIFSFQDGYVQLYRKDYSSASRYTLEWSRSALGSVLQPEIEQVSWFKKRLRAIECVRLDPPRMAARSEREEARPTRDFTNFPSWYRRALISNAAAGVTFLSEIREVIAGLESLDLHELGQGIMVLRASFDSTTGASHNGGKRNGAFRLDFNELSDGQRALIALYALMHFLVREDATLCIDEPDNFVALAEIQPWLLELQDRVDDLGAQVLVASHHPELLNLLAPDYGMMLERSGSGPTTARSYNPDPGSALSPAERIARGWEHE